jgi:hypothetical protein
MAKGPSNKYVCERVRHFGCEEHNCEQERPRQSEFRLPASHAGDLVPSPVLAAFEIIPQGRFIQTDNDREPAGHAANTVAS